MSCFNFYLIIYKMLKKFKLKFDLFYFISLYCCFTSILSWLELMMMMMMIKFHSWFRGLYLNNLKLPLSSGKYSKRRLKLMNHLDDTLVDERIHFHNYRFCFCFCCLAKRSASCSSSTKSAILTNCLFAQPTIGQLQKWINGFHCLKLYVFFLYICNDFPKHLP